MTSSEIAAEPPVRAHPSGWWRTVLGEYPTGITLITSLDEDGSPIGMIVGTFSAVSEEPPLIGFLPGRGSFTFGGIRRHGRFAASVLGVGHEELCRAFSTRAPGHFALGDWALTANGIPRLADAVSWYEADVQQVFDAGDHSFVLGAVSSFGVGDGRSGLPLLYLKGGYGSFAIPSLRPDFHRFGMRLRLADGMREAMADFARSHGVDTVLTTVAGESVVVLAAEDSLGEPLPADFVGQSFPFAAPLAPGLAAWGDEETRKTWIENSRHLLGRVDRPKLATLLDLVRERSYAVSLGPAMAERFDVVASDAETDRSQLAELWAEVDAETSRLDDTDDWHAEASSIQVPVFDELGRAEFELVVSGFGPGAGRDRVEGLIASAKETAARLSRLGTQGRTGAQRVN